MTSLPDALAPLAQYPQFICCKITPRGGDSGKSDKIPVSPHSGVVCSAQDATHWTDAENAIAAAQRLGNDHRVGYVLTAAAGFFCLDIDNCLQADGTWSPLALDMCRRFAGAAVEVSLSNRGLHIFGRGVIPPHANKNIAHGIELYSDARFIALGRDAVGNAAHDCTAALAEVVAQYFPPSAAASDADEWTNTPCAEWVGLSDDEQLIARACASTPRVDASAVFGDGDGPTRVSFADLWNRNVAALAKRFPDTGGRGREYDESSADMALALRLAYWTGKDMERMRALMLQSGLKRDKYEREKYLRDTIRSACARVEKVAQLVDKTAELAGTVPVGVGVDSAPRGSVLFPQHQPTFFHGCVYVRDRHQILAPGGRMLSEAQFNVEYGGRVLVLDAANEKTAKHAFEAFVGSRVNEPPKVDTTCFRPDLPPGAIIEESGRSFVNKWVPITVPRQKGDAGLFLDHVAKLLPNRRDQEILLSYMAACVQYQGVKFRWAPLIQGVQGNGKSTLIECVVAAIGEKYAFMANAAGLANKFNNWLVDNVFYGVEDIYVPDAQREVMEVLKPMITASRIEIEAKGRDQQTMRVCGNFMFNSNHRDAIRKTKDDRRFAIFFTAQQEKSDLDRCGMTAEYFHRLQNWLHKENGYAIVTELLYTYAIPNEFNPATHCMRAPETSSTEAAIADSLGGIEQEILEAVASGRQGFCGGWISSTHLTTLIKETRRKLQLSKRAQTLETIGYIVHPGLPGGRVNNAPAVDGARSILYVKRDHPAAHITGASAICKAYNDAQLGALAFGEVTQ
jgi:hypothetical protein